MKPLPALETRRFQGLRRADLARAIELSDQAIEQYSVGQARATGSSMDHATAKQGLLRLLANCGEARVGTAASSGRLVGPKGFAALGSPSQCYAVVGNACLPLEATAGTRRPFTALRYFERRDPLAVSVPDVISQLHFLPTHVVKRYRLRCGRTNDLGIGVGSRSREASHSLERDLREWLSNAARIVTSVPAWIMTKPADFYVLAEGDVVLPCYHGAPTGKGYFTAITLLSLAHNLRETPGHDLGKLLSLRSDALKYVATRLGEAPSATTVRSMIAERGRPLHGAGAAPDSRADFVLELGEDIALPVIWHKDLDAPYPLEAIAPWGFASGGNESDASVRVGLDRIESPYIGELPGHRRPGGALLLDLGEGAITAGVTFFGPDGERVNSLTVGLSRALLGRSSDADIQMADPAGRISRRHATFERSRNRWFVVDHSWHGTEVWHDGDTRRVTLLARAPQQVTTDMWISLANVGAFKVVLEAPELVGEEGGTERTAESEDEADCVLLLTPEAKLVARSLTSPLVRDPAANATSLLDVARDVGLPLAVVQSRLQGLAQLPELRSKVPTTLNASDSMQALAWALLEQCPDLSVRIVAG